MANFASTNTIICGPVADGTGTVVVDFTASAGTTQSVTKNGRYRMIATQPCYIKFSDTTPVAPVDDDDAVIVTAESAEFIRATGAYVNAIGRGVSSGLVQLVPVVVEA